MIGWGNGMAQVVSVAAFCCITILGYISRASLDTPVWMLSWFSSLGVNTVGQGHGVKMKMNYPNFIQRIRYIKKKNLKR